jgi:hypothetical protein
VQAIIGATQKRQGLNLLTVVMAAICLFEIEGAIIAQFAGV